VLALMKVLTNPYSRKDCTCSLAQTLYLPLARETTTPGGMNTGLF